MVKVCIVSWVAVLIFVGLRLGLPEPHRHVMWIPYTILLPLGIVFGNKKQRQIAQEESQNNLSHHTAESRAEAQLPASGER